jgi:hypothetical protein
LNVFVGIKEEEGKLSDCADTSKNCLVEGSEGGGGGGREKEREREREREDEQVAKDKSVTLRVNGWISGPTEQKKGRGDLRQSTKRTGSGAATNSGLCRQREANSDEEEGEEWKMLANLKFSKKDLVGLVLREVAVN